ncbi:hypothetical protein [Paraburkholderia sp. Cpub6]|uniref:hypothetical protein n=1 Tax=unclassified Paraburkholderia TaxID=2615204 RepID=UPI001608F070|nr:hypothetical protein [Paraburkholderia sp. Cpub6]MBB5463202.1 hypothetical protein [Paraburkholderia sp. Cpub6]
MSGDAARGPCCSDRSNAYQPGDRSSELNRRAQTGNCFVLDALGRYAEIFSYNDKTETFSLADVET